MRFWLYQQQIRRTVAVDVREVRRAARRDGQAEEWRELATKRKAELQAANNIEEVETQVLVEVNARFRKLEEARVALQVSRLSQETEREKLRVVSNRYSERAALFNDVLQTESDLAQANHQYRDALVGFWTAKADFEKAIGEE